MATLTAELASLLESLKERKQEFDAKVQRQRAVLGRYDPAQLVARLDEISYSTEQHHADDRGGGLEEVRAPLHRGSGGTSSHSGGRVVPRIRRYRLLRRV